jgi:hypothetical protein
MTAADVTLDSIQVHVNVWYDYVSMLFASFGQLIYFAVPMRSYAWLINVRFSNTNAIDVEGCLDVTTVNLVVCLNFCSFLIPLQLHCN